MKTLEDLLTIDEALLDKKCEKLTDKECPPQESFTLPGRKPNEEAKKRRELTKKMIKDYQKQYLNHVHQGYKNVLTALEELAAAAERSPMS